MANLDPHELTREIVENSDIAIDTALTYAGAAIGATLGSALPGAGTVAGGIAGGIAGQALSTTLKTSFGRLVGTYDATPEEQVGDIALETALAAGGYAIGAGVKAAAPSVINAFKKVGSSAAREVWANTIGFLTKSGTAAAETMVDNPGRVATTIKRAYEAVGDNANVSSVVEKLAQQKAKVAETFLDEATDTLPRKFKEGLDATIKEAGARNVSFDLKNIARSGHGILEDLGLGKVVAEGADSAATKVARDEAGNILTDAAGKVVRQAADSATEGRMRFVPFSEAEKTARGLGDLPEGAEQEIKGLVNLMERYASNGTVKGQEGAQRLAALNQKLNELSRDAQKSGSEAYKRAVTQTAAAYRVNINKNFADQGLGEVWAKTNQPYIEFSDAVKQARGLLNSNEGVYTFADKLTRVAGKGGSATNLAGDLVRLLGSRGQELYNDILVKNAAMKFAPRAPQLGFANVATTGAVTAASATLGAPAAIAVGAPALALSSPRAALRTTQATQAVAKVVPYAWEVLGAVKGAQGTMRHELLNNPAVVSQMYKQALGGLMTEEQTKQQLDAHVQEIAK
jgi:hypothetical protein